MEHSQSNSGLDQCHDCGVRRKQVANPTTNYGFVLPTPTDLVTDLPADFDVALQGVDTRLKALNPSTTLGDTEYASATANTNTRLAIGTTGQVLTVAGGVPSWATPAGATDNFSLLNAGGTALSGSTTSVTGISGMNTLYILVANASSTSSASFIDVYFNTDTTAANYDLYGWYLVTTPVGETAIGAGGFPIGRMANNAASACSGGILLQGCNSSGKKLGLTSGAGNTGGGSNNSVQNYWGQYSSSSTISSVQVRTSGGTFDGGTVYIYGSA